MFNACKPARFWKLSGMKHIATIIRDKKYALPRPFDLRVRYDALQLVGLIMAGTLGVAYSFGALSPPKDRPDIIRPKWSCEVPPKKKCNKSPPPCPQEEGPNPPKPCDK